MLGKIKWFKDHKGYGYIIGADEETYFFEIMNCINPNDKFASGDSVKFIPNFFETEVATEVEKVGDTNEQF